MTKPALTCNIPTKSQINPDAVTIAAEIVDVYPGTVGRWVQDALNGATPELPGTLQHSAWIAYRAAALALSRSAHEAQS